MRTTAFSRSGHILALCLFLAAGGLFGAEAPHPHPLKAHASIASLPAFIGAVDNFVVRAAAAAGRDIRPGTVAAILRAHMVVPAAGWRGDREVHILFLNNLDSPRNMVLTLRADSLDAFADGMAESGVSVERGKNGPGGRPMLALAVGGEGGLVAVDLGDGAVAVAASPESVAIAIDHLDAGRWSLNRDSDADLSVVFPMAGPTAPGNPMLGLAAEVNRNRDAILAELRQAKIDPRFSEILVELFEKSLPAIGKEMTSLRSAVVDCRFTDDALGLGVRLVAAPDSFLGRMGVTLEGLDNVDDALLRRLLSETAAWAAGAGAAPARVVPGLREWLEGLAAEFEKAFASGDAGEAASPGPVEALLALAGVDWAAAGGMGDGGFEGVLYAAEPAAEFAKSWDELTRGVNSLAEKTIADPALGFDIVAEGGDGATRKYRLDFRQPAHIDTLFQLLRIANPSFALTRSALESRRLTVGGDAERAVVSLEAAEADAKGAGAPVPRLKASSPARAIGLLPRRQGGIAVADADRLLEAMFMKMLRDIMVGMDPAHAALHVEALARALPTMRKTGDVVGFGFGAEKGGPVVGAALPYRTIGAALANYEIFIQAAGDERH